ncbi:MAG: permease-like cell division protein FtsX [Bacteroidetes bacterium]|nr:permease-like cell division protein FtsX [Bacteroidota bacterium]
MKSFQENFQKRRVLTGYFSVVISIALVLFFVGILGLFLINTQRVASHFKEQIALTIYVKDSAKDIEIKQLQKKLQLDQGTKRVEFTPKEEAAEQYARDIGEDFVEFLGYNPLLNSIDVFFNADFVNTQSLEETKTSLEASDFVSEVVYDQPLVSLLDNNIQRISLVLIFTSALFIAIALLLINSSIRLSIYSKRFIIKTMQMVGATKSFIRKPFILTHLRLGVISSLVALGGLTIVLFELNRRFPELGLTAQWLEIGMVYAFVVLLGLGITGISTFFATQRYLNLQSDAIY